MVNRFGEHLKQLREQNNLLQRQVAAFLEIDTPMLSKIERGERLAKKEQIIALAEIFKVDVKQLMALWLADQMFNVIEDEPLAKEAIKELSKKINSK